MAENPITLENARTDGRMPQSYWDAEHSTRIEGFATDMSVNAGATLDFKINVSNAPGSDYQVEIFRLGYYGGDGARRVASWVNTDAVVQAPATFIAATGTADAGNWVTTDSWAVPTDSVSGVYLARLQRLDAAGNPVQGAVNQIPFVVREDDRPADIVLQTSDTTWQAYNGWIGNNGQIGANFYGDRSGLVTNPDLPDDNQGVADRAYALSYNRPFISRGIEGQQGGQAAGAQDYLFGADYAAIYWLERNGYDVAYLSGIDTDRLGAAALTKYGAFISVGHDEYWSGAQRANVEAARDAGTHLLFWSGNEVYWKTRWEPSTTDGTAYRTLVSYKETWSHTDPGAGPQNYPDLDPSAVWTGTWRDLRFIGNPQAGTTTPENALTGQLFVGDGSGEFGAALDVPAPFAALRQWRDTTVAAGGGAVDLSPGLLGYEWDKVPDDAFRPAGLITLSRTDIDWPAILVDQGNRVEPGADSHALSLYRAPSGALVFGAGTTFWTWALSDQHDNEPYSASIENTALQQFVVNLFADMGIDAGAIDAVLSAQGLVRATASQDATPARALIDALPATLPAGAPVVISGTATDNDGNPATVDGQVALVELSFDGGATWKVASGTSNWSYAWAPAAVGTYQIRARAIDDSLNLPPAATLQGVTVQATAPQSVSLFDPWVSFQGTAFAETGALQLGTQFTPAQTGRITELHYYRAPTDAGDTDLREGRLWRSDGTLLATAQFVSNPGEAGWQSVSLAAPVDVLAGQGYVVSYVTSDNYVATPGFFGTSYADPFGFLAAPAGTGGVFATGAGAGVPGSSYQASNYWVDVTFEPGATSNQPPVFTSSPGFAVTENAVLAGVVSASDDGALSYAIAGGADAGAFSIDAATGALHFVFAPDAEAPADADADNLYQVTLAVSDGFGPPVTQAATVAVADVAEESGQVVSTLFGPAAAPAAIVTADPTDYELGMRLTPARAGVVDSLRYWRGAEDASDTDARVLNLWDAGGALLGSVTVTSAPGQSGWQVGVLPTPVAVAAGQVLTVSYGTTQNYAATTGYFATPQAGPDGSLSAGTGAGVYSTAGPGSFPTQTYQASNYWVDAGFRASGAANSPPAFTLADPALSAPENQTAAGVITALDPDGDQFVFAIAGGADAGAFAIGPQSGVLSFNAPPDFETPGDANADNVFELLLSVSDGIAPPVTTAVTVAVTDVADESAGALSTLFGPAAAPAQIVTADSTDYELGTRVVPAVGGEVMALRYWRGAADAGDTDTRTLTLWDASGVALASVTVVSTSGQTGWQTATLPAPVPLTAGAAYVVSYGTTQNYAFSGGFFAADWLGPEGDLLAPASTPVEGNGLYAAGTTGVLPTETYQAANYWVDLLFDPFDVPV